MSIIDVTLFSAWDGELTNPFINKFTYWDGLGPTYDDPLPLDLPDLIGWAEDFRDTVAADLTGVLHDDMTIYRLVAEERGNPYFADLTFDFTGDLLGNAVFRFDAWKLKGVVNSRVTRPGFKRFGIFPEGVVDSNGTITDSGVLAKMDTLEVTLQAYIDTPGLTYRYYPAIVGEPTGPPSNLPLRVQLTSAWKYIGVTTQNSRKA